SPCSAGTTRRSRDARARTRTRVPAMAGLPNEFLEVVMGAILNLVERNLHEVRVDADRLLFHIPSSSLFAADALTGGIIDALREQSCSSEDLAQRLAGRFAGAEIDETLRELIA